MTTKRRALGRGWRRSSRPRSPELRHGCLAASSRRERVPHGPPDHPPMAPLAAAGITRGAAYRRNREDVHPSRSQPRIDVRRCAARRACPSIRSQWLSNLLVRSPRFRRLRDHPPVTAPRWARGPARRVAMRPPGSCARSPMASAFSWRCRELYSGDLNPIEEARDRSPHPRVRLHQVPSREIGKDRTTVTNALGC